MCIDGVKLKQRHLRKSLLKLIKNQLAKHTLNIRKVEIQINDLSTERHGTLQQCKINILLPGLPSINVNTKGTSSSVIFLFGYLVCAGALL